MIHKLYQENYDSSIQILAVTKDNEFSGQVITRYEVREYPKETENHLIARDLLSNIYILSLDFIYKQICRLSKLKGSYCTYKEASQIGFKE